MQAFVDEFQVGAFEHLADEDGIVWADYGVTTQPAFVFINDTGEVEVIQSGLGADGLTSRLEALLN